MERDRFFGQPEPDWSDSGWVGAGVGDDLDERLAAEEVTFDERLPHVMTALGPIEPAALGITLVGAWDRPLVGPDQDPAAALLRLEQLYATGVRSVVDLASAASAASAEWRADLAWVSARAPVHIVVGADSRRPSSGLGGGAVRTGIALRTAEPASGPGPGRGNQPLFIRPGSSLDVARLVAPREATGQEWPPWTVVYEPGSGEAGDWEAILKAGAQLGFIVDASNVEAMPGVAEQFRELADLGFGDRLALAYDGDPILVMERMPIFLMEAGLAANEVRRILVDNPPRALTTNGFGT